MYESLERRLLLSSVIKNGVLTLGGGPAADTITLTTDGTNLLVTGIKGQASIPLTSFQSLIVKGGGGKDTINLSASPIPATILGGDGNDSITGSEFNDFIDGQGGADLLIGGGGNDTLFAGVGADVMQGGSGADLVDYSKRIAKLAINAGDGAANDGSLRERDDVQADVERIVGGNKADIITGSSSADSIDGGGGNDTIEGGGGDDTIRGGIGNDSISGGEGDDVLDGGIGTDIMDGGAGNDSADYSSRVTDVFLSLNDLADDGALGERDSISSTVETLVGGDGEDSLVAGAASAKLVGNGGNDTLQGGAGDDTLDGGLGTDQIAGLDGNDTADYSLRSGDLTLTADGSPDDGEEGESDNLLPDIETLVGGSGNDQITGGAFNESLAGGGGDDTLDGGAGNDTLAGQAGDDVLLGGSGDDDFSGGDGVDTADYSDRDVDALADPFIINQVSPDDVADDGLHKQGIALESDNVRSDIENITGTDGADLVFANASNNFLYGRGGNDQLFSLAGDDTLVGGAGNDTLFGGLGNDEAHGAELDDSSLSPADLDQDQLVGAEGNDSLMGGQGDDTLDGNEGNDELDCAAGNDSASGGDDNDHVSGGDDNDTLSGGVGNDLLAGEGGNDSVSGDDGDDAVMDYEPGSVPEPLFSETPIPGDELYGGAGADAITGGADSDTIQGEGGNDTVIAGFGDDVIDGGFGDDSLEGEAGNDSLAGDLGGDILHGGLDNDIFINAEGDESGNADTIDGGDDIDFAQNDPSGFDVLADIELVYDPSNAGGSESPATSPEFTTGLFPLSNFRPLPDGVEPLTVTTAQFGPVALSAVVTGTVLTITGTGGNDQILLTQDASFIHLDDNGALQDFAIGTLTAININGLGGNDLIRLEAADGSLPLTIPATLIGDAGRDTLIGGTAGDIIQGDAGNDSLIGGNGNDNMSGGDGNDIMTSGPRIGFSGTPDGSDIFLGGKGIDTVGYARRTDDLNISLNDDVHNDGALNELDRISPDVENIFGGLGNDRIVGSERANFLSGGGGNDTMFGQGGNDQLVASRDTDSVFGGAGNDFIYVAGDVIADSYNGGIGRNFFQLDKVDGAVLDVLVAEVLP